MKYSLIALTLFLWLNSGSQVPQGDRVLAWQVDMAEDNNYDDAFGIAMAGCMQSIHQFFTWYDLEQDEGQFSPSFIAGTLDVINIYYPGWGVQVELQFAPVNTVTRTVPDDLLTTSWDDPEMISRFKTALDTLFAHIPNVELAALNIGNEVDIVFGTEASEYEAYAAFLAEVSAYAKQLYFDLHGTELLVGTTCTHDGLTNQATAELCAIINESRDIITTTYYPLNPDFTMQDPEVVHDDFAELVNLYPDPSVPIYFAECGYASSETCNSSESLQAEFYSEVMEAWDTHSDNIKYLTIFKSTDWPESILDFFAEYYGIDDEVFLEYLRSLGVRTFPDAGENKEAYETLLCELELRGWCETTCVTGTNNPSQDEFTIYPVPANDQLMVVSDTKWDHILVYDLSGRIVAQAIQNPIDLSHLSKATYIVEVQAQGEDIRRKVFVLQ